MENIYSLMKYFKGGITYDGLLNAPIAHIFGMMNYANKNIASENRAIEQAKANNSR